ncbi:MAG TPA: hypothetical protein VFD90_21780 [Gaiellales bacterium]|jgi:hypothetical protein|nr:hypothetical protein [Gaiellales bacterium]
MIRNYRLVIDGELGDRVKPLFAGMTLTRDTGTTVLVGSFRDQAELRSLIERLSDLGLTLLSSHAIVEPSAELPHA